MGWGGKRRGAGRKKDAVKAADAEPPKVAAQPAQPNRPMFSEDSVRAIIEAVNQRADVMRNKPRTLEWNPYRIDPSRFGVVAEHVKKHAPKLAMDQNPNLAQDNQIAVQAWQAGGLMGNVVSEGLLFLGYPFLGELAQRPEFRLIAEIRAEEMVRKWTRLRGTKDESNKSKKDGPSNQDDNDRKGNKPKTDKKNKEIEAKIKELKDFEAELKIKDWFKASAAQDSFFGISHLLMDRKGADVENRNDPALKVDIGNGRNKVTESLMKGEKGWLKGFRTIEPVWVYPMAYNAVNPLSPTWYDPQNWYVMGTEVHKSQLLQFIGRPVPDILKPAYMFGGLSMSQMVQPYVDIWLKTRQSVGEIIHSFSVMVLSTNLATTTMPGGSGGGNGDVIARSLLFNFLRDNAGLFVVDKATEDFKNVSAPISGLADLQAQSQEHMCLSAGTMVLTSVGQIPIEKVTKNHRVLTRKGWAPIRWAGITGFADQLIEIETGLSKLRVTACHPIWSETTSEFVAARNVCLSDRLCALPSKDFMDLPLLGAVAGGGTPKAAITATKRLAAYCIECFGKLTEGPSPKAWIFTTKTKINRIIGSLIGNLLPDQSICATMPIGSALTSTLRLTTSLANFAGQSLQAFSKRNPNTVLSHAGTRFIESGVDGSLRATQSSVNFAELSSRHLKSKRRDFAPILAVRHSDIGSGAALTRWIRHAYSAVRNLYLSALTPATVLSTASTQQVMKSVALRVAIQPVYNLSVEDGYAPEFFANGILVHNCSVARIPLVKFTGIQPMGLNATSEGELRAFEETIAGTQEHLFRTHLTTVYDFMQWSLWGERDPDITFDFVELREETPKEKGEIRKLEAETDQIRIDSGVVSQEEVRTKLAADPESGFDSIDPDDVPDLLDEEEQGLEPEGGRPQPQAEAGEEAEGKKKPTGDSSLSKPEAEYVAPWADGDTQCRVCSMFKAPDGCSLVKGAISPRGHCDHFQAKGAKDDAPAPGETRKNAIITAGGDGTRRRAKKG